MRHTKLGASGLEILEFDGMDTLRVVARRLAAELGPGNRPNVDIPVLVRAATDILLTKRSPSSLACLPG